MDTGYYVSLGRRGIVELLEQEFAAVWPEIEAKIAERRWGDLTHRVQPHMLTIAKRDLLERKVIDRTSARTRGGQLATVFHLADTTNRKRRIEDASKRKRLLYARHQSWARGTKHIPRGLVGPGGETAVANALERPPTSDTESKGSLRAKSGNFSAATCPVGQSTTPRTFCA